MIFWRLLILLCLGIVQQSCKSTVNVHSSVSSIHNCNKETVSFSKDIKPILERRCELSGCHLSQNGPSNLADFNSVQHLVQSGKFKRRVIVNKSMPPGKPLSEEDYQLIRCWVENNTPNN